jgi:hypothetical protein
MEYLLCTLEYVVFIYYFATQKNGETVLFIREKKLRQVLIADISVGVGGRGI